MRVCGLSLDKLATAECAKSLETLTRLACNPECISTLVDGLASSLTAILDVAEHQDGTDSGFDRLVRCLLNQIVKVSNVVTELCLPRKESTSEDIVSNPAIGCHMPNKRVVVVMPVRCLPGTF